MASSRSQVGRPMPWTALLPRSWRADECREGCLCLTVGQCLTVPNHQRAGSTCKSTPSGTWHATHKLAFARRDEELGASGTGRQQRAWLRAHSARELACTDPPLPRTIRSEWTVSQRWEVAGELSNRSPRRWLPSLMYHLSSMTGTFLPGALEEVKETTCSASDLRQFACL